MEICLKLPIGTLIRVYVTPEMTIRKIKKYIRMKENISIEQQILIFNGKKLDNERTLEECGVKNESRLHLIIEKHKPISMAFDMNLTITESTTIKVVKKTSINGFGGFTCRSLKGDYFQIPLKKDTLTFKSPAIECDKKSDDEYVEESEDEEEIEIIDDDES